ncbi:MAG TPA: lytic transglycosylase domain-containing protein [bacterium]|nr:lytic transglycosylase domain-containing protein [bacterium]
MANGRRMGGAPWWLWIYAGVFAATLLLTLGLIYLTTVQVRTAAARFAHDAGTPRLVRAIPYAQLINETASAARLNPALLAAIISAESAFDPRARSARGAYGLMQVMPGTWREVGGTPDCRPRAFDVGRGVPMCAERPEANLAVGAAYLRRLADRFGGNMVLTVAAYNAGTVPVLRYHGVPPFPETMRYMRQVSLAWLQLQSTGTLTPFWSAVIRRFDLWQRLRGILVVVLAVMLALPWALLFRRLERSGVAWMETGR